MKTFTKIAFLLISACSFHNVYSQCTPDPGMPKGSILPETLKYAYAGTAYAEVIYFRAPDDTVAVTQLGTFPAHIDSMEITGVSGLPAGLSYTCNNGKCLILGGEASCVNLTGTTAAKGEFPLKVYIRTYATVKSFVDIPVTQNDSNAKYTLYVYGNVGLEDRSLKQFVSVYPNPARTVLNVGNTSGKKIEVQLRDLTGRMVAAKDVATSESIDLSQLARGIYVVHIVGGQEVYTQKIVVE